MTANERVIIGGILLAAGGSSRMGTPKQFVKFEGETLLRRAASAIASVCEPVIAVIGADREKAEKVIADIRVEPRFNREWKTGISSSIKLGLTELLSIEPNIDAVLITLCDQPFVDARNITRLIERFRETRTQMVAAKYDHVVGVPAIFSKEMFEQLLALTGDTGARDLLRDPNASVDSIEIKKAAIDVDTSDDVDRLKTLEHES